MIKMESFIKIRIYRKIMAKTQKPLETLVVEDNSEFINVARSVYDNDPSLITHYSSTYEEAFNQIKQKKFDGIITDLFFPSNTISTKKIYSEIGRGLGLNPEQDYDQYKEPQSFAKLKEEPSGLLVVEFCIEKEIPFVILSQGNRHHGELGAVRYFMGDISDKIDEFEKDGKEYKSTKLLEFLKQKQKPFYYRFLNSNGVDKGNPETWKKAIEYLQTEGKVIFQ